MSWLRRVLGRVLLHVCVLDHWYSHSLSFWRVDNGGALTTKHGTNLTSSQQLGFAPSVSSYLLSTSLETLPLGILFLACGVSNRTLLLKYLSSSNHMKLAARCLSSSNMIVGFLPSLRVVTMWCNATSGFKFHMLSATLTMRSIKVRFLACVFMFQDASNVSFTLLWPRGDGVPAETFQRSCQQSILKAQ